VIPESAEDRRPGQRRELILLLIVWIILAATIFSFARQNFSDPGLYYDEAVFGGLAKDFLTGEQRIGRHMPNHETVIVFGRPFPVFVQSYLGALKSWMYLPSFTLAGTSVAVLRATTFWWAALAVLLFMIATRKWLGFGTGIIGGVLLATDPNYFFLSTLDWGATVPSFLCRFGCLYLIARWRLQRRTSQIFWASFLAGLGFFNKIDFALILIGAAIAFVVCYWRLLKEILTTRRSIVAWAVLGFICGAGPMLFNVPGLLGYGLSSNAKPGPHELSEKFYTMLSMYDGSYFYRLMNAGGFSKMFEDPFGTGVICAIAVVVASAGWLLFQGRGGPNNNRRFGLLLLLASVLVTAGVFTLRGAQRLHHAILVYPLPQLLVSAAIVSFWNIAQQFGRLATALRGAVSLLVMIVLVNHVSIILKTQRLIRETGGRGLWSDSFTAFCRENSHRTDLTMVSLDWGFNEQLAFLTDGPRLSEPVWALGTSIPRGTPLTHNPGSIYLLHPPEYNVAPESLQYLSAVQNQNEGVEIQPYRDRQGRIAFYTIHFPPQ